MLELALFALGLVSMLEAAITTNLGASIGFGLISIIAFICALCVLTDRTTRVSDWRKTP